MKLLILSCLVAVALARPKLPLRQHSELILNDPESREEVLKERKFFKLALPVQREWREQREFMREKQSDEEQVVEDPEKKSSSSSSSEEVHKNTKQKHIPKEDMLYQRYLEQLRKLNKYNQLQLKAVQAQKNIPKENLLYHQYLEQPQRVNEYNYVQLTEPMSVVNQPFQQYYQLDAYPYAAWYYYPQYITYLPFYDITNPIASENIEKANIMPQW
ncbi:alpha-S1-casein isoform X3 [Talpa occidentalis]|uniref:alpha-S1-casein isoform X3 n=1 Tax=Talpa occidentalis TaxID=50954 RepID=UPI0023F75938|nr:alpha-S1-casein isoform X3 [Talpa occidentalis]